MADAPPDPRPPRPPRRDPLDDEQDLLQQDDPDDDAGTPEPAGSDWDPEPVDDDADDDFDAADEPAPTPWDDEQPHDAADESWSEDAWVDDAREIDWDALDNDVSGADEDRLVLPPTVAPAPEQLPIVGSCELVLLPLLLGREPILAEMDSRRATSVLRCPTTADVATPTQLDLALGAKVTTVQAPLVDGVRRLQTELAMAGRRFAIELELEPADGPPVILLGRDVLAGAFLIDVDQRFRLGRPS